MRDLTWPPIALTLSGQPVTAHQAKLLDGPFSILGHEVIPCVGKIVRPYWRSTVAVNYSDLRDGFEMSEWHYDKQLDAHNNGLEIEKQIQLINGRIVFADAYDPSTNTVIEYVWSHFDKTKISDYFINGFNQHWIFASDSSDYQVVIRCAWTNEYHAETQKQLTISIPTIKAEVQQ